MSKLSIIKSFESMGEYLDWLKRTPYAWEDKSNHSSTKTDSFYQQFTQSRDWNEAVQLLEGWQEGADKITALAQPIFDAISSKIERVDVNHDIEGAGIDIARYLEGEPECWQKFETSYVDNRGNRILQLVFNCAVSAGIQNDVIITRGSLLTALVQGLEFAGYRVEIWVVASVEPDKEDKNLNVETRIKVKEASQDMDMPRIAFVLAHPSMFRRLIFGGWERIPGFICMRNGYGLPTDSDFQGDIYCNRAYLLESQWSDPKKAEAWLLEQLTKQGVKLREEKK